RQVGHGDRVADGDLAHHRRGRAFEAAHAAAVAAAAAVLAALRFAAAPARAGGGTACAVGGRQVQLAGEARRGVVVVGDGVPAAALVLGRGTAVLGRARRRARRTGRRRLGRLRLGRGLALLLPGRFLGCLALLFLALALGLFLLALALGFLGALAVQLGQALLLGEVALAGFLQLAQHLGALVVHRRLGGRRLGGVDVGALLADLDGDGAVAAPAADAEFLHLAPGQGDLLRRSDLFGRSRRALAVGTAQEAEQLDLLGTGHDLVGTAELHAGLGQLLQQLLDRGVDQLGELANGGLLRHSDPMLCLAPPRQKEQGKRGF